MNNAHIREYARRKGVRIWEVANALNISDSTMAKKLRTELPEDEKEKMFAIINQIANNREKIDG